MRVWAASAVAAALLAVSANAPAQVGAYGVAPPLVEVDLVRGAASQALRVLNFGEKPVELAVRVHAWSLDEAGRVMVVPPNPRSLDRHMVVSPLRFTIPPEGSQAVRLAVRLPPDSPQGEYRAMVFFDTVAPETDEATGMRVSGRLGVAVYGQHGRARRYGTLHGIKAHQQGDRVAVGLDTTALSPSHVRYRGRYLVWPAEAYPGWRQSLPAADEKEPPAGAVSGGPLPELPVLPGCRRTIPLVIPEALAPGEYLLAVRGALGEDAIELVAPFQVAPEREEPAGERP